MQGNWPVADRLWRLNNLYSIKVAETGQVVPFRPRPEQQKINELLAGGCRRLIIIKARQLGVSTDIGVYMADLAAFNAGMVAAIVDQSQPDATRKLTGIVKVAFDSLPPEMRALYAINRSSDSGGVFEVSLGEDSPSTIYAGKNARGGTHQFIHISEWGKISATDPKRSEEILTGAIPSAKHGTIVIETTWYGGRVGLLWGLVKKAIMQRDDEKSPEDWRVLFFPWWVDPSYTTPYGEIASDLIPYFAEIEAQIGRKFTEGQKRWYSARRSELGIFIFREFPSTFEECTRSPVEGSIYASHIMRARSEKRIVNFPVGNEVLVHTGWDLGAPKNMVTWFWRIMGREIQFIDVIFNLDITLADRVAMMLMKGYPLGEHFLPHDAAQTERSGKSLASELIGIGLQNVRIVPQTINIWTGINYLRQIFPTLVFRATPEVEEALEHVEAYHSAPDTSKGVAMDYPVHDQSSHAADGLRTVGEALMAGMVVSSTRVRGSGPNVITGINLPGRKPKSLLDAWRKELNIR